MQTEGGLDQARDAGGRAAELAKEPPCLQGGDGLLSQGKAVPTAAGGRESLATCALTQVTPARCRPPKAPVPWPGRSPRGRQPAGVCRPPCCGPFARRATRSGDSRMTRAPLPDSSAACCEALGCGPSAQGTGTTASTRPYPRASCRWAVERLPPSILTSLEAVHAHNRGTIDELLRRGQEQGTVRPDLITEDLLFTLTALGRAVPALTTVAPEAWLRPLALLLDGLLRVP
jgi:hypothetical protein